MATLLMYQLTAVVLYRMYGTAIYNMLSAGQYMLTGSDVSTLYVWIIGGTAAVAGGLIFA